MKRPSYNMLVTALEVSIVMLEFHKQDRHFLTSQTTINNLREVLEGAKAKSMNDAIRASMFDDKDPHTVAVLKNLKKRKSDL